MQQITQNINIFNNIVEYTDFKRDYHFSERKNMNPFWLLYSLITVRCEWNAKIRINP